MGQRRWQRRLPWVRILLAGSVILVIAFFSALAILGSQSTTVDITVVAIGAVTALLTLSTLLSSFASQSSQEPPLQPVGKLQQRHSFGMGDDQAATFHYVIEPVQVPFEKARDVLLKAGAE